MRECQERKVFIRVCMEAKRREGIISSQNLEEGDKENEDEKQSKRVIPVQTRFTRAVRPLVRPDGSAYKVFSTDLLFSFSLLISSDGYPVPAFGPRTVGGWKKALWFTDNREVLNGVTGRSVFTLKLIEPLAIPSYPRAGRCDVASTNRFASAYTAPYRSSFSRAACRLATLEPKVLLIDNFFRGAEMLVVVTPERCLPSSFCDFSLTLPPFSRSDRVRRWLRSSVPREETSSQTRAFSLSDRLRLCL